MTDTVTGLMWIQEPHAITGRDGLMLWSDAQTYVNNLTFAGYSDWRLPHVNRRDGPGGLIRPGELDLVGRINADPDKSWDRGMLYKVFTNLTTAHCWSNTTYEVGSNHAWRVQLSNGKMEIGNKTYANYVWAVRGGN